MKKEIMLRLYKALAVFLLLVSNGIEASQTEADEKKSVVAWRRPQFSKTKRQNLPYLHTYEKSWSTQKADLRLEDYTDRYGYLKLHGQIKYEAVRFPHLFRVSEFNGFQSRFSLLILGSLHGLDLSLYPESLKELILSKNVLVVEDDNINRFNRERMKALGMLATSKWFELLDNRIQKHYFMCVERMFERYGIIDVSPWELTPFHALMFYLQSPHIGMDKQLVEYYKEKPLLKLEEIGSTLEIMGDSITHGEPEIEVLRDIINKHLSGGGALNIPENLHLTLRYLHGCFTDDWSGDATILRNQKWMPVFMKFLKQYPQDIISVVGAAHLYGRYGLLELFAQCNCQIEQGNTDGTWSLCYQPESFKFLNLE